MLGESRAECLVSGGVTSWARRFCPLAAAGRCRTDRRLALDAPRPIERASVPADKITALQLIKTRDPSH